MSKEISSADQKLPFWKQPLTPQLVIWVGIHVILTAWLWTAFVSSAVEEGTLDPKSTQGAGVLLLISFSVVVFGLAVLKRLVEWMLRISRRSGR